MRSLDESLMDWLFHPDEPHRHRLEDEDQNLWMKKAREEILEQSWWITNFNVALLVAFFSLIASWFLATRDFLFCRSLLSRTKGLMVSSNSPRKGRYSSGDSHKGSLSGRSKSSAQKLLREKRPEDSNRQDSCTTHHDKRSVSGVSPRFRFTSVKKSLTQSGSSAQDRQLNSPVTVVRSGDKEADNVFTGGAGEPHLSSKNRRLPFRAPLKDIQEIEVNRSKQAIPDQRAVVSRVHLDNFAKIQYSTQTHGKVKASQRKAKQCEHRDDTEPSSKKAVVKKTNKRKKIVLKNPTAALATKSKASNKRSHELSTRTSSIICVEEAASDLLSGDLESIRSKYLEREVNINYLPLSPPQPAPKKVIGQARIKTERDPITNGKRHPPALQTQGSAEGRANKKGTRGVLMRAKDKKHERQETCGELSTSQSSLPFEEWACPTQKVKTKTLPFQNKNKTGSEYASRATENRELKIDYKPKKAKMCINHAHQHFEDSTAVDDKTYFKNGKRKLSAAFPECPVPKYCEVGTNLDLECLEKTEERHDDRASVRQTARDSQGKGPLRMSEVAAGDSMPNRPRKRVLEEIRRKTLPAHGGQVKHQTVAGHKYRKRTIKLLKDALVSVLVKAMGKLQLSPAQPVAANTQDRQEQTYELSSTYADQTGRGTRPHRKRMKVLYGQNNRLVKRILSKGAIEGVYRTSSPSSETTCEAYQKRQATRIISPSCGKRRAVLLLHAPRSSSKPEGRNIELIEMADVPVAQAHHSGRDHKDPSTTMGLLNQLLQSATTSRRRCSGKCRARKEQETEGTGSQASVTQVTYSTPEHSRHFAQCHKLSNDVSDSEKVTESIETADEEDSDSVFRSPSSSPERARNKPFTSNKKTNRTDTVHHQPKWASVIKPRISLPHCVSRPYNGNTPQSTKLLKRRQCMHRYQGHRVSDSGRENHYFKKAQDTLCELRDTACFKLSQRKLREENSPAEDTHEKNSTSDCLGSSTLDILSQITVRNSNSPTNEFKGDDFTEKESEVLLNGEETASNHFNDSRAQIYWNDIRRKSGIVHKASDLMRASFTSSKAVSKFTGHRESKFVGMTLTQKEKGRDDMQQKNRHPKRFRLMQTRRHAAEVNGKTASEYGHKDNGDDFFPAYGDSDQENEVMNQIRSHQSLSDGTEKETIVRRRTKIPRYVKNSQCNWQPSLDSLDKTHAHQPNGIQENVRDQVTQNLQINEEEEGNIARYEIQGHTRVRNTSSAEVSNELSEYKRPMPSTKWNSHQRQSSQSKMKHPRAVSKETAANFSKYDRAKLGNKSDMNKKGNTKIVSCETEARNDFIGSKLKKKTVQGQSGIQAVKSELRVKPRASHTTSIILHPRAWPGYDGPNRDLLASQGDRIHVDEATDSQGTFQGPRSSSERLKHMCSPEACRLCGTHTHHNKICDLGRNDTKTSHQQYTLNSQVHKSGGHSASRLREPTTTQQDSAETCFIQTRQAPFSQKIQVNRPTSTGHHADKNITKTHKQLKEPVSPLNRDAKKTVKNRYESNQRARESEGKLYTSGQLERSTVSRDKGSQSPVQARVMTNKTMTDTSKSLATSRILRPSRIPVLQRRRREASICRGKQQCTQQNADVSYSKQQESVLYSFICNCLRSMPSGKSKNMPFIETEDLGFTHRVPFSRSTSNISFSKDHHHHFRSSAFDYIYPNKPLILSAITYPRREDSTSPKLFDKEQFKAGYHKYIASPSIEDNSCGQSKHCSMQRPDKSESSLHRNTRVQVCQGRQYASTGGSLMSQFGSYSSRNTDSPGPQRECQKERFQRESQTSERKSLAGYKSSSSKSVSCESIKRYRPRNGSHGPTNGMHSGGESPDDLKHDTKQCLDHLSRSPETLKNNVWRKLQHDSTAENKLQSPIETGKSDTGREKKSSAANKAIAGRSPHQVKQTKTSLQRLIARQKQLESLASIKEDDRKNVVKQKVMAENKQDGSRIKHYHTSDCHGTAEPADRRRVSMKESKTTSLSKRKQVDNVFQAPVRSQVVAPKPSGKKGTAFTSDITDTGQISPIGCPSLKQTTSPVMYFTEVELPGSSTCRRTKLVKTLGNEDMGENITPQECAVVVTTEGQEVETGASRSLGISKVNFGDLVEAKLGQAPGQLQDVKRPHEECETLKPQWDQLHGAQIDRGILNLRNTDVLQQRTGANEADWAQVRASDTTGSGSVMREKVASILSQARNVQKVDHNGTPVIQNVNARFKMKGPASVAQNGLGMVGPLGMQNQSDDTADLLTSDLTLSPNRESSSHRTVDVESRPITTLTQTLDSSGGSQGRTACTLSSKSISTLGKASVGKGQRLGEHKPSGPLVPLRHLTDIHSFHSFQGSRRNRSILNKIKVLRSRDRLHKLAAAFSCGESDSLNKTGKGTGRTLESNTTTPSLLSGRRPLVSTSHQVSVGLVVGEEDKQEAAHHLSENFKFGSEYPSQSTYFNVPASSQNLSAPQVPKDAEKSDLGVFTTIKLTCQPKVKENQAGEEREALKERERGMANLLSAQVKQVASRENPISTLPDSVLSSADVSLSWRINSSEPDIFNCSGLQIEDQDTGMISREISSGQKVSEENKLPTFPEVTDINNHMVSLAASSFHMTYAKNCSSSISSVKRQNVLMNSDVRVSDMLQLDQNKNRRARRRNGNGSGRQNRIQESPHNFLQRKQVISDKTKIGTPFDSGSTLVKYFSSYKEGQYYHSYNQINARPKSTVGTQIRDWNQRGNTATTTGKAMEAKREREVAQLVQSSHHSGQQNIRCRVRDYGLSEYELRTNAHDRCERTPEESYVGQPISQSSSTHSENGYYGHAEYSSRHQAVNATFAPREGPHRSSPRDEKQSLQIPMSMHTDSSSGRNVTKNNNDDARTHSTISIYKCHLQNNRIRNTATPNFLPVNNFHCCDDRFTQRRTKEDRLNVAESSDSFQIVSNPSLRRSTVAAEERNDTIDGEGYAHFGMFNNVHQPNLDWYKPSTSFAPETARSDNLDVDSGRIEDTTSGQTRHCPSSPTNRVSSNGIICERHESSPGYFLHTTDYQPDRDRASTGHSESSVPAFRDRHFIGPILAPSTSFQLSQHNGISNGWSNACNLYLSRTPMFPKENESNRPPASDMLVTNWNEQTNGSLKSLSDIRERQNNHRLRAGYSVKCSNTPSSQGATSLAQAVGDQVKTTSYNSRRSGVISTPVILGTSSCSSSPSNPTVMTCHNDGQFQKTSPGHDTQDRIEGTRWDNPGPPSCSVHTQPVSGFSYLYNETATAGVVTGSHYPASTERQVNIKVRGPRENTFVGHLVKMFENKLRFRALPTYHFQ